MGVLMKMRILSTFLLLLGVVQVMLSEPGDIFMVGDVAFCNVSVPKKMTREEWYRAKLKEQDDWFKAEIMSAMSISMVEVKKFMSLIKDGYVKAEVKHKSSESSILGTWYVDAKFHCSHTPGKGCSKCIISSSDMNAMKKKLASLGFQGEVLMKQPSSNILASAGYNTIYLRPLIFFGSDQIEKTLTLCHELRHIHNQDVLWSSLFNWMIKLFGDKKDIYSKASRRNKCDVKRAKKLLKKWKVFLERRADLEGVFDACKENEVKVFIKKHGGYEGFPFHLSSPSAYAYQAKVHYIKDFFAGVKHDYKLHFAALKVAGAI